MAPDLKTSTSLTERDVAALHEFAQAVRSALGSRLLGLTLYGSKATGRAGPESDIDVMVLVDEITLETENRVFDLAFDVGLKHEVFISPRVLGRAQFQDPVWRVTGFSQALERDGIPL